MKAILVFKNGRDENTVIKEFASVKEGRKQGYHLNIE